MDGAKNIQASLTLEGTNFAVLGFWDEASQKVSFQAIRDRSDPRSLQVYTGYLFADGKSFVLTGFFESFAAGSADRNVFGWYAVLAPR